MDTDSVDATVGALCRVAPFPCRSNGLQGTFDYERAGGTDSYYVVDATGRHRFYCGYLFRRTTCLSKPEVFRGQPITVWSTLLHGSLQIDVAARSGMRPHPLDLGGFRYEERLAAVRHLLYLSNVRVNYVGIVLLALVLCWLAVRWHRAKEIVER